MKKVPPVQEKMQTRPAIEHTQRGPPINQQRSGWACATDCDLALAGHTSRPEGPEDGG